MCRCTWAYVPESEVFVRMDFGSENDMAAGDDLRDTASDE
jgi:hypothetical protein